MIRTVADIILAGQTPTRAQWIAETRRLSAEILRLREVLDARPEISPYTAARWRDGYEDAEISVTKALREHAEKAGPR